MYLIVSNIGLSVYISIVVYQIFIIGCQIDWPRDCRDRARRLMNECARTHTLAYCIISRFNIRVSYRVADVTCAKLNIARTRLLFGDPRLPPT